MTQHEKHRVLYPGYPVPDEEAFRSLRDRFTSPPTVQGEETSKWTHGDLVEYLLSRTEITSPPMEVIGSVSEADREGFTRRLADEKRSATIHLPESDYAIPPWAAHFGGTILKIVKHEHATNPRADKQVAQLRFKQVVEGQRRGPARPHLDMTDSGVEDYHIYLAASDAPTTAYEGRFTYEPHPYPGVKDEPLEFFRDLDAQFERQADSALLRVAHPYDIIALHALTVHKAAQEMPVGRTLLGIQFYRPAER